MARKKQVRVESVLFNGSKHDLRELLLQWNVLRGVTIEIIANDYVGGSFDVVFSRTDGGPLSKDEAKRWISEALRHVSS